MEDTFTIQFQLSVGYISYKFIKNANNTYNIIRIQNLFDITKFRKWENISNKEVKHLIEVFATKQSI